MSLASDPLGRYVPLIAFLGALVLALGLGLLFLKGAKVWRTFASLGWPEVTGRVVSLDFEWRSSRGVSRGFEQKRFRPKIEVEYAWNGITYSQLVPRSLHDDFEADQPRWLNEAKSRYAEGTRHSVHVDPSDPTRAVLSRGPTAEWIFRRSLAAIALGFACFLLANAGKVLPSLILMARGIEPGS